MKRTLINKKSKRPIKKLKAEAWRLFSLFIRMRDCLRTTGSVEYGECITCNNTLPFEELQAGHFIPGRHNTNLFSEKGVHAQCKRCNLFLGGNQLEYRRQIIKLYGEGYDEVLEEENKIGKKSSVDELEAIIKFLKEKIKLLEI
ncbi:hypothetical protein LCGC14_1191730 [marine sediment metagenome]|uniref:Uncharacterized protein n=1 Tax=marine sediment metagenome TaxID=412755 RepID=A0A0F9PPG4_9ZZZZ